MTNSDIADVFSLYSKLMDIHQENAFKVKSYANAAFQIDRLPDELSDMPKNQIASIRGIGESIAKKVIELIENGELEELNLLEQQTPDGVLELLKIKGIGPKKIAVIWKELQIESPGELLYACNENRLINYKGFGLKTQQGIQEAIEYYFSNQSKFLFAQAETFANYFTKHLGEILSGCQLAITGDYVRQANIIERIEFVVAADLDQVAEAISADADFILEKEEAGTLYFNFKEQMPVEITCCEIENFTEQYFFTLNPPSFNDKFQALFPDVFFDGEEEGDECIFERAGIPYIVPCLREDPDILNQASSNTLPNIIQPLDIKGVIHNHSKWSDGNNTIEEMALACIKLGYEYLVMSDHSVTSFYANGLTTDRIMQQQEEIDRLNEKWTDFKIFKSIECDILGEGQLDYDNDVLASFDLVIASVHQNLKMTEEKAMKRIVTAIQNPYTTILGHPSGRLLLSRKEYPLNYGIVIDKCAEHNVVIEINANPRRLDIDWQYIPLAMQKKVMLSINPDAHSIQGIQDIRYGVLSAQKGGLTAKANLSSLSLLEFEAFLLDAKKKQKLTT